MQIYLVGGAVRDQLLGLPITERDWVVVGATPEEMLAKGYLPVGKEFPVFLHPQTKEEYALARTERKISRGYAGFSFYTSPDVTLIEDLQRRDLTINAIALSAEGKLIDPYGGQADLEKKLLRHVSNAFPEDPLRILRAARFLARFYQYDFSIAPQTMELMAQMVANHEVNALVAERVWQETHRALNEKNPEKFFETLRHCGALKVLFPEIDALFGVPAKAKYHPEIDTGVHVMMVLQTACILTSDPKVRFAALLHDLGKGTTPENLWPSHIGHEEKGLPLIRSLCSRYKIPKQFVELALLVAKYHGLCHRALELRGTTLLKLLESIDAFRRPARLKEFLLACEADSRGRLGYEQTPYPQADFILKIFAASAEIQPKDFINPEMTGDKIAAILREKRLRAIKISMENFFCHPEHSQGSHQEFE